MVEYADVGAAAAGVSDPQHTVAQVPAHTADTHAVIAVCGGAAGRGGAVTGEILDGAASRFPNTIDGVVAFEPMKLEILVRDANAHVADADADAGVAGVDVPAVTGLHSVGVVMPLAGESCIIGAADRKDDPVGMHVLKIAGRHERRGDLRFRLARRHVENVFVGLPDILDQVVGDHRGPRGLDMGRGVIRFDTAIGPCRRLNRTGDHLPGEFHLPGVLGKVNLILGDDIRRPPAEQNQPQADRECR